MEPVLAAGWCPGLAVGIINKGEEAVWGYGTTSYKKGTVPDGDTVYEIGSITKLFTKLLLSDMVHRGKMRVEDRVQQYLPEGVSMPAKNPGVP